MKRRLIDRIHDRAWCEVGQWLARAPTLQPAAQSEDSSSSISAGMPWAEVCAAFANGTLKTPGFRRNSAVRNIVETVGPVDGRFYGARIREWAPAWLTNARIARVDAWGDPIRWPGRLLGMPRAFSPTTLRYLATALWLQRQGYILPGGEVIEIGVGYGGLAAMNALVSGSITTLVDLPAVEQSAMRMLDENGLGQHGCLSQERNPSTVPLVISNYAFSELNAVIQDQYLERYLKRADHGVIISNAGIFAATIHGRSDLELIAWLRAAGLDAKLEHVNDLLAPSDHLCGVSMIRW